MILCNRCGKKFLENGIYIIEGKNMCEDCAIKAGLYPLGHTGLQRDKISEKGRCLTVAISEKNWR